MPPIMIRYGVGRYAHDPRQRFACVFQISSMLNQAKEDIADDIVSRGSFHGCSA
ncbi:MAG: hypothetical protein VX929_12235 [Pseudomonadota bacterium]|nr:hypothetical protein [Pseudomonadota bacterium]